MMPEIKFISLDYPLKKEEIKDADFIEHKKKINKIISNSRKAAKEEKCICCDNKVSSFCNSHTLPAFCLRNIADNGEVYATNKLIEFPFGDESSGVNKSGTFQLICRKCDSERFQEYENPENYGAEISPQMVAQIAMKNFLKMISKRKIELQLYGNIAEESSFGGFLKDKQDEVIDLDLNEYLNEFKKAKRLSTKNWDREYYTFFYKKLNYVVPFAFQGVVALVTDLEGNIINNIYNKSSDYRIQDLHICTFPLENETVIIMFVDSKDKRYRVFYKQFLKLPLDEQLSVINYIIFLYSEDVFLARKIDTDILNNKELKKISRQTSIAMVPGQSIHNVQAEMINKFTLSNHRSIPNLYDEKYKLR